MIAVSRFISGVSRGQRGRTGIPARAQPHQTSASWARPATGTDQICQSPTSPPVHQPKRRKAIIARFIRIGAAAGSAKRPSEFSTPERSAVSEIGDVGKGDPPVLHRQREALVAGEAARHREDEPGHGDCPAMVKRSSTKPSPESASRAKLGVLAGLDLLGEHRHEGEVERPLGEEAAEHVRQREGDQERLRHRAGAEQRRHHDVAREAETRGTMVQEPTLRKAGRSRIPTAFIRGASVPELIPGRDWQIPAGLSIPAPRVTAGLDAGAPRTPPDPLRAVADASSCPVHVANGLSASVVVAVWATRQRCPHLVRRRSGSRRAGHGRRARVVGSRRYGAAPRRARSRRRGIRAGAGWRGRSAAAAGSSGSAGGGPASARSCRCRPGGSRCRQSTSRHCCGAAGTKALPSSSAATAKRALCAGR